MPTILAEYNERRHAHRETVSWLSVDPKIDPITVAAPRRHFTDFPVVSTEASYDGCDKKTSTSAIAAGIDCAKKIFFAAVMPPTMPAAKMLTSKNKRI
jgi:hypothetical protein